MWCKGYATHHETVFCFCFATRATLGCVAERACSVSFTDSLGIKHSVDVTADSLFEAAVLGLKILRSSDLKEAPGRATVLEIDVRNPGVRHYVSLLHVSKW